MWLPEHSTYLEIGLHLGSPPNHDFDNFQTNRTQPTLAARLAGRKSHYSLSITARILAAAQPG